MVEPSERIESYFRLAAENIAHGGMGASCSTAGPIVDPSDDRGIGCTKPPLKHLQANLPAACCQKELEVFRLMEEGEELWVNRLRINHLHPGITQYPITVAKVIGFSSPLRFEGMVRAKLKPPHVL
jgi:hypothetical protein